jgi:hypothetical protein
MAQRRLSHASILKGLSSKSPALEEQRRDRRRSVLRLQVDKYAHYNYHTLTIQNPNTIIALSESI